MGAQRTLKGIQVLLTLSLGCVQSVRGRGRGPLSDSRMQKNRNETSIPYHYRSRSPPDQSRHAGLPTTLLGRDNCALRSEYVYVLSRARRDPF